VIDDLIVRQIVRYLNSCYRRFSFCVHHLTPGSFNSSYSISFARTLIEIYSHREM
jgi:hypothetical protein